MNDITIRQGFKYRLRPKAGQAAHLRRTAGCCRFVWNAALAEQQARHARGEPFAGYVEMAKWLTAWKQDPDRAFLKEPPVHAMQSTLKDLDEAFRRFFLARASAASAARGGDAPRGCRKEGGHPLVAKNGREQGHS